MSCYLDYLPRDLRDLLSHYVYRHNWEEFKDELISTHRDVRNYDLFNQRLRSYGLKSRIDADMGVQADIEDVITDFILVRTLVSTCLAILGK